MDIVAYPRISQWSSMDMFVGVCENPSGKKATINPTT